MLMKTIKVKVLLGLVMLIFRKILQPNIKFLKLL
jgi:hypothetical protein